MTIHEITHRAVNNSKIANITASLSQYLQGKEKPLSLSLICFFSKGHLLIEDLPGLGKTTLAVGIARSLGLTFGRIQCTSDLLPTDITGLSIYNKNAGEFEFHAGPIFNNIVLCDEINRATPKTQSALLEAMGEKQVTIEGKTYSLPKIFFVMATQNPTEQFGAFPLPESQLDRFMMKIQIGYPSEEAEREILRLGSTREELYSIEPVIEKEEVIHIQEDITKSVFVSEKIFDYTLAIIKATRKSEYLTSGLSTRGALTIISTARTNAYFKGRDFVISEDIKELVEYTIPHRVLFREEYESLNKREIITSLIEHIPTPA
ncbi:MAG: AAA family ATPase [Syntrophus sp. (in: bacteria)]|nr:AAA family ATPase [Syntrophus sp. (in: bacteria)]